LISEKGDATADSSCAPPLRGASEEELRADMRFLINLWNEIKQRSESSKVAGADLPRPQPDRAHSARPGDDNFSTIWVDSESEYERVVRFLQSLPAFAGAAREALHQGHAAVRAVRHSGGDQQGAASRRSG
jgi:ribonuclease E